MLLNRTGALADCWLLSLTHTMFILNHTFNYTIKNVPLNSATGSTCDVSPLLRFTFYQPVYYVHDDSEFPSDSTESQCRFVVVSENVGHAMTFKILSPNFNKILHRSNVRAADDPSLANLKYGFLNASNIVKYLRESYEE